MKIADIKNKIQNGGFDNDFVMLYGETEKAKARYLEAVEEFEKLFPSDNDIRLFSAPGRTEVGGNHTDHQHGCVLAGGVDMD
ncbi:MAG: galactokinase family protein, partial [Clostridia bacterium]|nr:galactokinase family protein [Clostridia bacterium]